MHHFAQASLDAQLAHHGAVTPSQTRMSVCVRAFSMPRARMVSATPSSGVASTSGSLCAAKASLYTADEYSLSQK